MPTTNQRGREELAGQRKKQQLRKEPFVMLNNPIRPNNNNSDSSSSNPFSEYGSVRPSSGRKRRLRFSAGSQRKTTGSFSFSYRAVHLARGKHKDRGVLSSKEGPQHQSLRYVFSADDVRSFVRCLFGRVKHALRCLGPGREEIYAGH